MASKKKAKKKSKNRVGLVVGSILRSIVEFLAFFFKVVFKILTFFGLWIPLIYAAFGWILYLALDFNPFKFDTLGTLYLCGGLACVVAAAIISVRNVIVKPAKSIYNGYKHPIWKKAEEEEIDKEAEFLKYAERSETVKNYKKESRYNPPEIEDFRLPKENDYSADYLLPIEDFSARTESEKCGGKYSLNLDWLPKIEDNDTETVSVRALPKEEEPLVYFSKIKPELLIHEYSDRFEVFRMAGEKCIPVEVKYK